jgi:hypothetical protein
LNWIGLIQSNWGKIDSWLEEMKVVQETMEANLKKIKDSQEHQKEDQKRGDQRGN